MLSFLLARLSMDSITGMTRIKEVRKAMQTLPTNHEDAYRNTFERILSQTKKRRRLALETLNWVCNSKRPLKIIELQHAIAIGEEDLEEVSSEDIESSNLILSSCLGLVVLSQSGKTVEMLHSTAKDFVIANQETVQPNPNFTIMNVCLKYMSMPEMKKGLCTTVLDLRNRVTSSPFLEYSTQYYGYHTVKAPGSLQRLCGFLNSDHLRQSAWQILHFVIDFDSESAAQSFERIPSQPSILHVGAYWGFLDVIQGVLATFSDQTSLDIQDSHGWTPLHWAASNGNDDVIDALINAGATIDAQDLSQWTPLFWAVVKGHETSTCLLLERSADAFHVDNDGLSPLHWSIICGWENITANLIEHAKNLERRNIQLRRASSISSISSNVTPAAKDLSVAAAKAILASRMEQRPKEKKVKNLFQMAGELSDYTDFAKLLVLWHEGNSHSQPGLEVEGFWGVAQKVLSKRDKYGLWEEAKSKLPPLDYLRRRFLLGAIADDNFDLVRGILSLRYEASLDLDDPINIQGDCYVHLAAAIACPEILLALIDNDADRTLRNLHGSTILHRACETGSSKMVETILELDKNKVDAIDNEGRTPLMVLLDKGAWRTDSCPHDLIRILINLIEEGANIHAEDSSGNQVIHFAMKSWSPDAIQLLIDQGADVRALNNRKESPLHILASSAWKTSPRNFATEMLRKAFKVPEQCIIDTIDLLVKASPPEVFISLCSEDFNKRTALSIALQNENWLLAQRLHELGAKFGVLDKELLQNLLFKVANGGHTALVQLLLENCPDIPQWNQHILPHVINSASANFKKNNPSAQEYLFIMRELLRRGANIHGTDPSERETKGMTAVQLAAEHGMEATFVSILLQGGAGKTYPHADLQYIYTYSISSELRVRELPPEPVLSFDTESNSPDKAAIITPSLFLNLQV